MRRLILLVILPLMLGLQGCASEPVNVFPLPPAKYEVLGPVTGVGCGTLALVGMVLNFIPLEFNSRVERAYRQAVETIPQTTSLINVRVREDWFWWVLATTRCTVISGDAVREIKP